ncbi:MAG: universal stress protein [Acidobacteria bacterium]|nr:universal stress protein [Acidobacteriota bacterium]
MYSCVLVPLDGSALAAQVLPYAEMVAKSTGATVLLLRVMNPYPAELVREGIGVYRETDDRGGAVPSAADWEDVLGRINSDAQAYLDQLADTIRSDGVTVETAVKDGDPADCILEEADKDAGTLIAMTTHGRSGVGRWLLGSVTDKIVRGGRHPMLVTRAQEGGAHPVNRVVLSLDGSELSEQAMPHAVEMAKALGVGVTVLRAVSLNPYGEAFTEYAPIHASQDVAGEMESEAQDYVAAKIAELQGSGLADVTGNIVTGYPATVILDEVGEAGDKLVTMATHGRAGVARLLLGSVTDRVVRHSAGPVFVVRPA